MAVLGLGLYNLFILRIINVNGKSLQGYTVYIETFVCVCVYLDLFLTLVFQSLRLCIVSPAPN